MKSSTSVKKPSSNLEREVIVAVTILYLLIMGAVLFLHYYRQYAVLLPTQKEVTTHVQTH